MWECQPRRRKAQLARSTYGFRGSRVRCRRDGQGRATILHQFNAQLLDAAITPDECDGRDRQDVFALLEEAARFWEANKRLSSHRKVGCRTSKTS